MQGYAINASTGVLAAITGSPFSMCACCMGYNGMATEPTLYYPRCNAGGLSGTAGGFSQLQRFRWLDIERDSVLNDRLLRRRPPPSTATWTTSWSLRVLARCPGNFPRTARRRLPIRRVCPTDRLGRSTQQCSFDASANGLILPEEVYRRSSPAPRPWEGSRRTVTTDTSSLASETINAIRSKSNEVIRLEAD